MAGVESEGMRGVQAQSARRERETPATQAIYGVNKTINSVQDEKDFICPEKHNSLIQPPGHVLIYLKV